LPVYRALRRCCVQAALAAHDHLSSPITEA
jgi:hypothetical protein